MNNLTITIKGITLDIKYNIIHDVELYFDPKYIEFVRTNYNLILETIDIVKLSGKESISNFQLVLLDNRLAEIRQDKTRRLISY